MLSANAEGLMLVCICRKRYLVLWFWVDAISCIPLECIFYDIAPHVYWYNIPKFIRWQ